MHVLMPGPIAVSTNLHVPAVKPLCAPERTRARRMVPPREWPGKFTSWIGWFITSRVFAAIIGGPMNSTHRNREGVSSTRKEFSILVGELARHVKNEVDHLAERRSF